MSNSTTNNSNDSFNWEAFRAEAIRRLQQGDELNGRDGIMTPLIKQFLEAALEGELDAHLAAEKAEGRKNRRNGKSRKLVKTTDGQLTLENSRDREGTFSPQLLPKRQTTLGPAIDRQIIGMYTRGMSYEHISEQIETMYGFTLSKGQLSAITDRVLPMMEEWRARPLETVYCFVWFDCLFFKVRQDGRVVNKAVYCVLALDQHGHKDLLGLYIAESEGAHFWLSVLTDLKNRGVEDMLIACVDGLKGLPQAIESLYPRTEVQLCIVHQVRNTLRYIGSSDQKPFLADLKQVYQAPSESAALNRLDALEAQWGERYPAAILSWRNNWVHLSHLYKYDAEIRRIMYTTNAIESFHRQVRQIAKPKAVMPSDQAVLKLIYLVSQRIIEKWNQPVRNWGQVVQRLAIHFAGRLSLPLNLEGGTAAAAGT